MSAIGSQKWNILPRIILTFCSLSFIFAAKEVLTLPRTIFGVSEVHPGMQAQIRPTSLAPESLPPQLAHPLNKASFSGLLWDDPKILMPGDHHTPIVHSIAAPFLAGLTFLGFAFSGYLALLSIAQHRHWLGSDKLQQWMMMSTVEDGSTPNDVSYVPKEEVEVELKIKNSLFIGTVGHTTSPEEARAFVKKLQERYPDASHWCYAFAIGHGASVIQGMSDDGEPSGTAGKPILNVLMGSGLGDCTVVVTRYFGGTKLGTGGLVKAYTQSAQAALIAVPRQAKVAMACFSLVVSYELYQKCRSLIEKAGGVIGEEVFEEDVSLTFQVRKHLVKDLEQQITDVTRGNVVLEQG